MPIKCFNLILLVLAVFVSLFHLSQSPATAACDACNCGALNPNACINVNCGAGKACYSCGSGCSTCCDTGAAQPLPTNTPPPGSTPAPTTPPGQPTNTPPPGGTPGECDVCDAPNNCAGATNSSWPNANGPAQCCRVCNAADWCQYSGWSCDGGGTCPEHSIRTCSLTGLEDSGWNYGLCPPGSTVVDNWPTCNPPSQTYTTRCMQNVNGTCPAPPPPPPTYTPIPTFTPTPTPTLAVPYGTALACEYPNGPIYFYWNYPTTAPYPPYFGVARTQGIDLGVTPPPAAVWDYRRFVGNGAIRTFADTVNIQPGFRYDYNVRACYDTRWTNGCHVDDVTYTSYFAVGARLASGG